MAKEVDLFLLHTEDTERSIWVFISWYLQLDTLSVQTFVILNGLKKKEPLVCFHKMDQPRKLHILRDHPTRCKLLTNSKNQKSRLVFTLIIYNSLL